MSKPDDDTPTTADWFRAEGWDESVNGEMFRRGVVCVWSYTFGWYVSVSSGNPVGFDHAGGKRGPLTRGNVRHLLAAFEENQPDAS